MINGIFKNVSNSFFRTLGRILCYLAIGTILAIIFGSRVHALTFDISSQPTLNEITLDNSYYNITQGYSNVNNKTISCDTSYCVIVQRVAITSYLAENSLFETVDIKLSFTVIAVGGRAFPCDYSGGLLTCEWYSGQMFNNFQWSLAEDSSINGIIQFSGNAFIYNYSGSSDDLENAINSVYSTQKETNSKLDEANETLTSEDDDTTSSKCGIVCKLKGIWQGITNLPSLIWGLFEDGLKSLFVPTDAQLYEIVEDSQELAENFGFVGESVSFFIDIFTSLLGMVNENGCAVLPEFTIGATSLTEEHTFWNEQQVCLADNSILNDNITTIRTITSIALVCLFINFAASKFFGILSKNDSGTVTSYDGQSGEVVSSYDYSSVNGNTTRNVRK